MLTNYAGWPTTVQDGRERHGHRGTLADGDIVTFAALNTRTIALCNFEDCAITSFETVLQSITTILFSRQLTFRKTYFDFEFLRSPLEL